MMHIIKPLRGGGAPGSYDTRDHVHNKRGRALWPSRAACIWPIGQNTVDSSPVSSMYPPIVSRTMSGISQAGPVE